MTVHYAFLGNPWQMALVILVIVLLFGRGKVSDLMGDVAKGIKSFKKGLSDEDSSASNATVEVKPIEQQTSVKSDAEKVQG